MPRHSKGIVRTEQQLQSVCNAFLIAEGTLAGSSKQQLFPLGHSACPQNTCVAKSRRLTMLELGKCFLCCEIEGSPAWLVWLSE